MTLLRRAGLSSPRPDLSRDAARDVGAEGFCLKKKPLEVGMHKSFFFTSDI